MRFTDINIERQCSDEERDKLRRRVGAHGMNTSALLGDTKILKETIEYIEKTGRFTL